MGSNTSSPEADFSIESGRVSSLSVGSQTLEAARRLLHKEGDQEEATREDSAPDGAKAEPATPRTTTTVTDVADAMSERAFPLPEGWRVVCRLSASDVRSRWGTRPRPMPANSSPPETGCRQVGTSVEAALELPETSQPVKLPLQLLPKWEEPSVGAEFAGRYEIKGALPRPPFLESRGRRYYQVLDKQAGTTRMLQVCDQIGETDVKLLVERFQLESLDTENRLFAKFCDVAFALPRHLAMVEDLPRQSLWEDFRKSPAELGRLQDVLSAVLGGLCKLHSCGWAHCSVSPDTICLASDGAWKLTGLENARRISDLALGVPSWAGAMHPPESLLGLPLDEKVDVWHLGAALCEASLGTRIHGGADRKSTEHLCALVDRLGPLPSALLARSPLREDFFTPEGHLLREVAAPGTETTETAPALEAIEPLPPGGHERDEGEDGAATSLGPGPRLVEEAFPLQGSSGLALRELLAQLLAPDPGQRPTAKEALEGVQRVVAEGSSGAEPRETAECHVEFQEVEDAQEEEPQENAMRRKGTGFVRIEELPPSDDEEEEEEAEEEADEESRHVHITAGNNHIENNLHRKGTGFVSAADLPDSESDEEDEDVRHAAFEETDGGDHHLACKGTGFVKASDLPPSDDEEEDEEESKDRHMHLALDEPSELEPNHLARKGTGFVRASDLPPSDDESEEEEEEQGDAVVCKGTGFVRACDLPPSDDEDEDEDEEEGEGKRTTGSQGGSSKSVQLAESPGTEETEASKPQRKGTGFVRLADLPVSDDEESEDDAEAKPAAAPVQKPLPVGRGRGTGVVRLQDLPSDEEEEGEPAEKAGEEKETEKEAEKETQNPQEKEQEKETVKEQKEQEQEEELKRGVTGQDPNNCRQPAIATAKGTSPTKRVKVRKKVRVVTESESDDFGDTDHGKP